MAYGHNLIKYTTLKSHIRGAVKLILLLLIVIVPETKMNYRESETPLYRPESEKCKLECLILFYFLAHNKVDK